MSKRFFYFLLLLKPYSDPLFVIVQTLVAYLLFFYFFDVIGVFATFYAKIILAVFGLVFFITSLFSFHFKKKENSQSIFNQIVLKSFRFLVILCMSVSILFQSELKEQSAGILFIILYAYYTVPELIVTVAKSFRIK